jgi:hypothetical protein
MIGEFINHSAFNSYSDKKNKKLGLKLCFKIGKLAISQH